MTRGDSQLNGATSKSSSLPWEILVSPLAPWPPPSSIEAGSHCFTTTVPALHHENCICNALTPIAMETTFSIARLFEPTEEEGITILALERTSSHSCSFAGKRETTTSALLPCEHTASKHRRSTTFHYMHSQICSLHLCERATNVPQPCHLQQCIHNE